MRSMKISLCGYVASALRSLLVLMVVLTALPANAQNGSRVRADSARSGGDVLIGTVVDVVGRPMQQVEVYIAGVDRATRTDSKGLWRFPNPPNGPRVVVARQIGYMPSVREVVVNSRDNDTVSLLLRRYPRTLSTVEVNARSSAATANANIIAERLMQIRVGSGRLFTRETILQMRPYTVAELIMGIPGVNVTRGQSEIIATSTRAGVGTMNVQGTQCQLQFYLDNTPIANEALPALDPMMFRSVEVYPQALILTGLAMRAGTCGAVVINTTRR